MLRLLEREPRDRFPDAVRALDAFERRHLLVSPRLRRQLVAGGLAACLAAAAGFAAWDRTRATLSTVSVAGSEVVAVDQRGRELWRKSFDGLLPVVTLADVAGDEHKEVVVQLRRPPAGLPESFKDLRVLSSEGRELAEVASSLSAFSMFFPSMPARISASTAHPLDLDGDARPELVWVTAHAQWYPAIVGAWNLRDGSQPRLLFVNSGSIHGLTPLDLDGDGKQEILACGINNPMGFQLAVAAIKPEHLTGGRSRIASPDLASPYLEASAFSSVLAYNVLGPFGGKPEITNLGSQGLALRTAGRTLRLDLACNPEESAAFGQGFQARDAFWGELAESCLRIETGESVTEVEPPGFETRHAAILREPPMRQASVLLLARALARVGRHADAIELLTRALAQVDSLDIWLRLGNQQAILGEHQTALASLARATREGSSGRPSIDAIVSRVLVAALQGNESASAQALKRWQLWTASTQDDPVVDDLKAMHAFCRADWAAPSLASQRPDPITPVLPALRAWAAFRRSGDAAAAQGRANELLGEPETAPFGRLLLAEIAWRHRTPTLAVELATGALAELNDRGRESWEAFAWVALAERVLGDALVTAGRPAEAAPHLARARHLAPGAWFGQTGVPTRHPPAPKADRST